MNWSEIKEEAKLKIKGNLWNLWKPTLVILAISYCISLVLSLLGENLFTTILSFIIELFLIPLSIGAVHYVLNFIRGEEFSLEDLTKFYKNNMWTVIGASLLVSLIVFGGTLLFIIPGIVLSYMYIMVNYILADGEAGIKETLNKSKEMMHGYKMDYFLFALSFIGWILLCIITIGIASIYVVPYVEAAMALYYDKLKLKSSIEK